MEEVEELLEKLQTFTSVSGQGDADVARDVIVDISEVFGKDLSPVTYGKSAGVSDTLCACVSLDVRLRYQALHYYFTMCTLSCYSLG